MDCCKKLIHQAKGCCRMKVCISFEVLSMHFQKHEKKSFSTFEKHHTLENTYVQMWFIEHTQEMSQKIQTRWFWNLSQSAKSVKIPSLDIKIISRLDFVNPIHLPCSAKKLHQIWHIYLQMRIMSSNWAAFTSNPLGVAQTFLLILKKSCLIGYVPWYQLKDCMTAILLSQINLLHNMHFICQKFEVCH